MKTKEDVLNWLATTLEEMVEIDPDSLRPESSLAELDIDSIDAVDVMVRFRELTGKRVEPQVFKSVRTVQDLVDALHDLIAE